MCDIRFHLSFSIIEFEVPLHFLDQKAICAFQLLITYMHVTIIVSICRSLLNYIIRSANTFCNQKRESTMCPEVWKK